MTRGSRRRPSGPGWRACLAATGLAVAFGFLGRLDRDARGQRQVYGYSAPSATRLMIPRSSGRSARRWRRSSASSSWRARPAATAATASALQAPPRAGYRAVALDPNVVDRELLESAFTLARLDESLAEGSDRAELAWRSSCAIWARLERGAPGGSGEIRSAPKRPSGWRCRSASARSTRSSSFAANAEAFRRLTALM